ncbi:Fip1 motif-domain-containing protein [Phascolomyces articulosus]|uniref:Fip1 motif-domain-containing protein n=1 Tax=Phascolomyces articulosus TaxID=60185 RepID=A0AAD5KI71_9FUNG|nr:Fip1 motif-domain-containing protein [Phascolomyces articulosus]
MNPNNEIDDDEVDEFLYGSSSTAENGRSSMQKDIDKDTDMANNDNSKATNNSDSTSAKNNTREDDDDLYQLYGGSSANETQEIGARQEMEIDQENDIEEKMNPEADTMEDYESEDDLEIILEPEDTGKASHGGNDTSNGTEEKSGASLVNIKPGQQSRSAAAPTSSSPQVNVNGQGAAGQQSGKGSSTVSGINLEQVGEYNGQAITDVDLDSFEDRPWRKPGADITDYFNYGFNEVTWKAYCAQQKMFRENKKMMGDMDMSEFMPMGMMMPPGAMVDGGMPLGMPGIPNPMLGLPGMGVPPPGMSSPAQSGSSPAVMRGVGNRGPVNIAGRGGRLGITSFSVCVCLNKKHNLTDNIGYRTTLQ